MICAGLRVRCAARHCRRWPRPTARHTAGRGRRGRRNDGARRERHAGGPGAGDGGIGLAPPRPGSSAGREHDAARAHPRRAARPRAGRAPTAAEEEQRAEDEAKGRKKRKRVFIGAGVTVGVVALIAVGYAVAQPDEEIEAQCVDEKTGVIVDDSNCAVPGVEQHLLRGRWASTRSSSAPAAGSTTTTTAAPARSASPSAGGTTTVPKDGTRVRTSSGSSTVTRGGLGVPRLHRGSVGGSAPAAASPDPAAWAAARAAAAERMERRTGTPRAGWHSTVTEQGLVYDAPGRGQGGVERPYWDESVHYVFSMDEILALEADVELLHSMCLRPSTTWSLTERFRDFALPEWSWEAVAASWRRSDPHVYGRFDLRYDGTGPAKLLEYNADTPTTLLEASILQWYWLKDVHPDDDQWNSLHEKLVERWASDRRRAAVDEVHFTWSSGDATGEDHVTVGYLQETAAEAGLDTVGLAIEDIGWDAALDRFVDLEEAPMNGVFKLYPWEWVLGDDFGKHVVRSLPETLWIEPLWKTLLSNKALLAVLWELYPGHPNLLPAYLDEPGLLTEYVRKPRLGREGANISIVAPGTEHRPAASTARRATSTSSSTRCPSSTASAPRWARGSSATPRPGLGIRETVGLVTDDGAAFVPPSVIPPTPAPRRLPLTTTAHRPRVLLPDRPRHRRDPALRRPRRAADAARLLRRRHHHPGQAQPDGPRGPAQLGAGHRGRHGQHGVHRGDGDLQLVRAR